MGLGVLPGRELELVCQLVKRGVGGAGPVRSSSPVRPLQRLARFAARESDLNSSSVLRKVAPGYRFQGEISFRGMRAQEEALSTLKREHTCHDTTPCIT